jgi:uncharacterized protein (DUF2235 family)
MLIFRGEMKNIVICFDGTWNTLDAQFPTNVIKTAQLVSPADRQGVVQAVCYDEGVGSMEVAFGNTINRLLSGAFGFGLMDNIERAYRYLTFNYTPGDRIYIFGFSRGAFSARSFAGLLRACGILRKDRLHLFGKAIETYQSRNREAGPDAVELVQFRRENSFAVYTGEGNEAVDQHPLSIEYVGVWDTVGSLGIPGNSIFASRFNRRYQFHDLALSRMVKSARHALAIDERRSTFKPTPWSNLDALNTAAGASHAAAPPYEQIWFPGDHSTVGGGTTFNGLWQAALIWVVEGALSRGLAIDEAWLDQYRDGIDHTTSVETTKGFSLTAISRREWRDGPAGASLGEVAEVGQRRIKSPAEALFERQLYRPQSLKAYLQAFGETLGISTRNWV